MACCILVTSGRNGSPSPHDKVGTGTGGFSTLALMSVIWSGVNTQPCFAPIVKYFIQIWFFYDMTFLLFNFKQI